MIELGILDILPRSRGVITKPLAVPTELIISKKNKWHEQWTNNLPPAIREPPQSILWKPRKTQTCFTSWKKFPGSFSRNLAPIQKAWPTTTWLVKDLTICSVQLVSSFKSPYPSNPFPTAPGGNGGNSSLLFICQARSASRSWPCMGMWMLESNKDKTP